jgi:hypothetical protein
MALSLLSTKGIIHKRSMMNDELKTLKWSYYRWLGYVLLWTSNNIWPLSIFAMLYKSTKNYIYDMMSYAKSAHTFDTVFFSGVWSFRHLIAYFILQIINIFQEFLLFPYHCIKSGTELLFFICFLGGPAYILSLY